MIDIRMYSSQGQDLLLGTGWKLGLCGSPIDDRGRAICNELSARCDRVEELHYNHENACIQFGKNMIPIDDFPEYVSGYLSGPIVLEATTLGFVEILACCRALRTASIDSFNLTYLEPVRYRRAKHGKILHSRDFELSDDVPGFKSIPGNIALLDARRPMKGVFFLGYEESRFRRAFEDLQMPDPSRVAIAFGVPAFRPGWELDALSNNIKVIREENVRGGIYYCGAANPMSVVELLFDLRVSLSAGERMIVAPLGTKPHGIGVALFASLFRDTGVLYDHPHKRADRTGEIATWHRFDVSGYGAQV